MIVFDQQSIIYAVIGMIGLLSTRSRCYYCVQTQPYWHWTLSMITPNRLHNSGKEAKRRLKPQAKRARKAALQALKRKLRHETCQIPRTFRAG